MTCEVTGRLCGITFNRPEKGNAGRDNSASKRRTKTN